MFAVRGNVLNSAVCFLWAVGTRETESQRHGHDQWLIQITFPCEYACQPVVTGAGLCHSSKKKKKHYTLWSQFCGLVNSMNLDVPQTHATAHLKVAPRGTVPSVSQNHSCTFPDSESAIRLVEWNTCISRPCMCHYLITLQCVYQYGINKHCL